MSGKSNGVFLSYASEDSEAAQRIADALKAAGVEVWFDQSELRGGDAWDRQIRDRIRDCRLFIPIISARTEARDEGYFRREWRLAVERAGDMHAKKAFLVPVVIDGTKEQGAAVPDKFRELQWTRLPSGEASAAFVERIQRLLLPEASRASTNQGAILSTAMATSGLRRMSRVVSIGAAVAAVLAVLGYASIKRFAPQQLPAAPASGTLPTAVVTPSPQTVAVLPFVNLSGNPAQEYFSDGLTEEITAALANVPRLSVVARTSAFRYKGRYEDVRDIGRALSATNIIEGSVRKEGSRVRIAVQLIRTDTGDHVWTESYNRDLKDVFQVQEDIARAVAAALQVPLGIGARKNLVANRTNDTATYEDYLHARALFRARDIKQLIDVLGPVVKRDPTYAPAWALLALGYAFDPLYLVQWGRSLEPDRTLVGSAIDNAERAAREAIRLDPDLASGHAAVGWLYGYRGQWAAADRELAKALALDPSDPDALHLQSLLQAAEGRVDEALKTRIALGRLEPFVPIYNASTAVTMQINGDFQGAIRMLEPMNAGGEVEAQRVNSLALAYAATGQYQRAVDTILAVAAIPVDRLGSFKMLPTETADILRRAPATIDAPRPTPVSVSLAGWVYAFVGAPDRTLDGAEIWLAAGMRWSISEMLLWHPALAAARKTDRFKALVRKLGLVDYWRATRWPQSCHPVGGSDFACE